MKTVFEVLLRLYTFLNITFKFQVCAQKIDFKIQKKKIFNSHTQYRKFGIASQVAKKCFKSKVSKGYLQQDRSRYEQKQFDTETVC